MAISGGVLLPIGNPIGQKNDAIFSSANRPSLSSHVARFLLFERSQDSNIGRLDRAQHFGQDRQVGGMALRHQDKEALRIELAHRSRQVCATNLGQSRVIGHSIEPVLALVKTGNAAIHLQQQRHQYLGDVPGPEQRDRPVIAETDLEKELHFSAARHADIGLQVPNHQLTAATVIAPKQLWAWVIALASTLPPPTVPSTIPSAVTRAFAPSICGALRGIRPS